MSIFNEILPLHSVYVLPFFLASSNPDIVKTCVTSFAPVVAFFTPTAFASDFFTCVDSTPSKYTCMLSAVNELVTLLVKSFPASSFVLPLSVTVILLFCRLFLSIVSADDSFIHSVLYLGFIVPLV